MGFVKIRKVSTVGLRIGSVIGHIENFSFFTSPLRHPEQLTAGGRPRKQRAQWKVKRYGRK